MRHSFIDRFLSRHDWVPVHGDRWPGGLIIFSDECPCGKRRERWWRWRDGPLTDAERDVVRG